MKETSHPNRIHRQSTDRLTRGRRPTPHHTSTLDSLSVAMANLAAGGVGFEVLNEWRNPTVRATGEPGPRPSRRAAEAA